MSITLEKLQAYLDKKDTPERLAMFENVGEEYWADAEFLNLLKEAIFELYDQDPGNLDQNNIGKVISVGFITLPETGSFTLVNAVVAKLNTLHITVSPTDTPVIIVANVQTGQFSSMKYRLLFKRGRGFYGINGVPITVGDIEPISFENFLMPDEDEPGSNTRTLRLGPLPNHEFLDTLNAIERDFSNVNNEFFVSYTIGSVSYLLLFTGDPGIYGGGGIQFIEDQFKPVGISTTLPQITFTSQLINDGANGTDPFATVSALTAVEENSVKKTGSASQTILGDIILKGKMFIQGVGSLLDGSTVNALFKKVTSTENIEINAPVPTLANHAVRKDFAEGLTNGMTISVNQAAAEMYLKNSIGTTLATINLGFLNNEGTTFFYNSTTKNLELKNDAGVILSVVPVSAFVSNLIKTVNFNGTTPSILEFKDSTGAVVASATFTINNIAGLQAALDLKANKDGSNASGTWGINVSGSSASATSWGGSSASFGADGSGLTKAVGLDENNIARRYTNSSFKLWLAIAITDIVGLSEAIAGKVAQTITNGVTTSAPSQDAVFDALALKANLTGGNSFSGRQLMTINDLSVIDILNLINYAYDINSVTGEIKMKFGFQSVQCAISAYKQSANTAGIKFYTALGYNNEFERARLTNVGNFILGDAGTADTLHKFQVEGTGRFTGQVTVPNGTALTSAVNKGQLDAKVVNGIGGMIDAAPSQMAVKIALDAKADLVGGKIPAAQLPSYVDDVLEYANLAAFPATGETGKLYIAIDSNLVYRWGGTSYVVTSTSLALGETSTTAGRGDRAKVAFDHSLTTGNPHGTTINDIAGLQAAIDAKVKQTITNGVTTTAPSEDAVFDALALKANASYKVYTAIISQSGTNAPVVLEQENTTGAAVVWTRGAIGQYFGTFSSSVFVSNKTIIHPIQVLPPYTNHAAAQWSGSIVNITTTSSGANTDGLLSAGFSFIEVRVYN